MTDLIIPPFKKCPKCGEEKPLNAEWFCRSKGKKYGFDSYCKACRYGMRRTDSYVENHRDYMKRYWQAHPDKAQFFSKKNYLQRKLTGRKQAKRDWRIGHAQRRARKQSLPNAFTSKDWLLCLDYWDYCCAVCGGQLRDLFGNVEPHADHWIPLSYKGADNPGTVPSNMICLCNSCNSTKHNKLPELWLTEVYGKRKARTILARIHAYFKWIMNQEVKK